MGNIVDIEVSYDGAGRYICLFRKDQNIDFVDAFEAYGFVVWTAEKTHEDLAFFPVKMSEKTSLTKDLIKEMWERLTPQM